jgi:hypothetical protein
MKTLPACLAGIVSLSFPAAAQLVFTEIHYHPVEGPAFNADGTTCHHLVSPESNSLCFLEATN